MSEQILLSFDGTVLELFGGSEGSRRFHVEHLRIKIKDADRKGRRMVEISGRGRGDSPGPGLTMIAVEPDLWIQAGPLLEAAGAAGAVHSAAR